MFPKENRLLMMAWRKELDVLKEILAKRNEIGKSNFSFLIFVLCRRRQISQLGSSTRMNIPAQVFNFRQPFFISFRFEDELRAVLDEDDPEDLNFGVPRQGIKRKNSSSGSGCRPGKVTSRTRVA